VGAISIGTFLARVRKDWIVRFGLAGFAVMLAGFAVVRSPVLAYPVVALVGTFYFAMITALSTAMQERLADAVRGRFMALWIMGFGGVISVGNLIGGPIAQVAGPRYLLLAGAVAALRLAWYADVRPPLPLVSPEVDSGLSAARR
jgi:predicted MFS family arabinose efflux permease